MTMTASQIAANSTHPTKITQRRDSAIIISWILMMIAIGYGIGTAINARLQIWLLSEFVSLIFHSTFSVFGLPVFLFVFIYIPWISRHKILAIIHVFITVLILGVGVVWNGSMSYEPIQSIWHNGSSYHLMFAMSITDYGRYEILKCNTLGVICESIFQHENDDEEYWIPSKDAKLEWNQATQQVTFILNKQPIFTEQTG